MLHFSRYRGRRRGYAAVAAASALLLSAPLWSGGQAAAAGASTPAAPADDYAGLSYLDGVSGPRPVLKQNLAGTWQFQPLTRTVCTASTPVGPNPDCVDTPALGEHTTIQVPGGGWVKQGFTDVSEALYSREIRIPDAGRPQVTKLVLGAVNHEATVYINPLTVGPVSLGQPVGTTTTSFTPTSFDLTPYVEPGQSYTLSVKVKGRMALRDAAGYFTVPEAAGWSPDIAQGIFRSAELGVYPTVHVSDVFVRPSVSAGTLTYDVAVTNLSGETQEVSLTSALASVNGEKWKYPALPAVQLSAPPGKTTVVTVGPVRWTPGHGSYWWPNVPYRSGYRAQLHDLTVSMASSVPSTETPLRAAVVRFGFREIRQVADHYELNGVKVNFRGDSLQGADYDSIDHAGGKGDAYDTYPGFLAPSSTNPGWPRVVDNYQRLNYNSVRIHQMPPTPYMLDVADAMGLMIMGETAIRGSNLQENFLTGRDNMVEHVKALVRRDRNHASVLRWSVSNEPNGPLGVNQAGAPLSTVTGQSPGSGPAFDEALYQTAKTEDPTRPISSDGNPNDLPHDDYSTWCHYDPSDGGVSPWAIGTYTDSVCEGLPSPGKPNGQGEFIWSSDNTAQGLMQFATATKEMREKGAEDTRPYTLLSGWASLVPGVRRGDMALELGYTPLYGEDNLPQPWENEQIKRIQRGFSPVLVADTEYWKANKYSDSNGRWPTAPVTLSRGVPTTRNLVVFNDTFAGRAVTVTWSLREGSATGQQVAGGTFGVDVPLGEHLTTGITFTPPLGTAPLYLVLSASKDGQGQVFSDDATYFM